jgi:hypothetical protein
MWNSFFYQKFNFCKNLNINCIYHCSETLGLIRPGKHVEFVFYQKFIFCQNLKINCIYHCSETLGLMRPGKHVEFMFFLIKSSIYVKIYSLIIYTLFRDTWINETRETCGIRFFIKSSIFVKI